MNVTNNIFNIHYYYILLILLIFTNFINPFILLTLLQED